MLDSSAASGSLRACQKNDFWWTIFDSCAFKIIRLWKRLIHQSVTDSKRMPKLLILPKPAVWQQRNRKGNQLKHQVQERVGHWQMRNVYRFPEVTKGMGSYLSINRGRKAQPSIYWGGKPAVVEVIFPVDLQVFSWLYYFPIAAVTNYHKPDSLKTPIYYLNNVIPQKFEMGLMELKSKTCVPPGVPRRNLFPSLCQFPSDSDSAVYLF